MNAWMKALEQAYEWAYRSRLAELNGKRPSNWRSDGLHTWSWLWGQIDATEPGFMPELMAEAPEQLHVDPPRLRTAADADALATFTDRLLTLARAQPQTTEEETEEEA